MSADVGTSKLGICPCARCRTRIGAENSRIKVEEGRVRAAFQVNLGIIISRATCERERIRNDIESNFTEDAQLLVRAADIVAENHNSREWSGFLEIASRRIAAAGRACVGQREVRQEAGRHAIRTTHKLRAGIGEVIEFLELQIAIERACGCADARILRRADAEFLREHGGIGIRCHEQIWCLAGRISRSIGHIAGIDHGCVTDVVWQVLADKQIVRVVDLLLRFPVSVCAAINNIERAQATFDGPTGVGEIIFDTIVFEALDFQIIKTIKLRIGEEYAVALNALT